MWSAASNGRRHALEPLVLLAFMWPADAWFLGAVVAVVCFIVLSKWPVRQTPGISAALRWVMFLVFATAAFVAWRTSS